jgi:glycosyltransferase involved in cell wall biosynthesis
MDEADIMVVPLQDNIYNRCKSDIKFLETATATKPGVYSDLRQYHESIEHGITGFLADSPEDWYESLKILIESVKKRKEIGENAYNYVKKFRQIDKYVPAYAEFILKVLGI